MVETAQFKAGKSFGEKSIEENKPWAATVYVKSDKIIVAVLTRRDYKQVIGESFKIHQESQITMLKKFNVLS
jgi:CRP-like cAMP-binding protein